jgi:hypothetical protein
MIMTKAGLNRRIKISKTGRPYVEVADLVKTRIDRIDRARNERGQTADRGLNQNAQRSGNGTSTNNGDNHR